MCATINIYECKLHPLEHAIKKHYISFMVLRLKLRLLTAVANTKNDVRRVFLGSSIATKHAASTAGSSSLSLAALNPHPIKVLSAHAFGVPIQARSYID